MGLQIVFLGNANDVMPIFGGQKIIYDNLNGKDYSTFIKTEKENIKFTLLLSLLDTEFTPQMNENLGSIFGKTKPIKFELGEDRQKMLYVVPTSDFEINRLEKNKGTLPITFEATTPYWLSPVVRQKVNLNYNGTFSIQNRCNVQNQDGNYDIFPYFKFTISDDYAILTQAGGNVLTERNENLLSESAGNIVTQQYQNPFVFNPDGTINFQITHTSDNNRTISFNNLKIGETIEMEDIYNLQSSTKLNRFPNWNKEPFKLHKADNRFRVNFPCNIYMETQFPLIR